MFDRSGFLVLAFSLSIGACSGSDGTGPRDDGGSVSPPADLPASVVAVSASVRRVRVDIDEVTVQLRNNGGPGVFTIEFWGVRNAPFSQHILWGSSESLAVQGGFTQNLTYRVPVNDSPDVDWVITKTRQPDGVTFVQNSCFLITALLEVCPP